MANKILKFWEEGGCEVTENIKHLESEDQEVLENRSERQNIHPSLYDRTDVKKAELAMSQVGYKALFDNMPNECAYYKVVFDGAKNPIDLTYIQVNIAYEKSAGCSRNELIGKGMTEILPQHTDAHFQLLEAYIKVALFGEPVAFTQYFNHKGKWYSIFAYSPQYGYVVVMMEDVTTWKAHETKLDHYVAELSARNMEISASRSRYRGLLDQMQSIFEYQRVIIDKDGKPVDLELAEVNPAFEKTTGLKIADTLGRRLPMITHGIDKEYWIRVLGAVALTGQPTVFEEYLKSTDTWYRVTAYSPEKGYVASILEDITEQKQAEALRRDQQWQLSLVERLASMGTLATGVAHEINQPLQALKIMADGMIYWYDKGKETSVEKVIENCRRISVQAGYISDVVEWMQDLVNKEWTETPEQVDVNQMIKRALNMVQERLRSNNIHVIENTCLIAPTVWGDVRRLKEIVIIILVNAMEALDGAEQATKEIVITTCCVAGKAVLEISNNGPSIPDDIIGRIFEPFFSSSKSGANLGMGLSIVQSFIDANNGTIQVMSGNQQVTFRIELPLHEG